ncbi:DEAD/DEAH box helicase [Conexibacter woesei]|uniref:DEAD/DEAH box helicase n=1 Tax=Conexibacter woesei TaxID=191495 RepID=UPI000412E191|nr:DEAD/DEAH box helicase [Conexibacter woesei]
MSAAKTFADLGVSKAVSGALAKRGFTEPFAIQNLIIGDILDGRDVLAKSPTGSGKTLAFGVPMLDRIDANSYGRPSALVLAPTRELASQIVDELYPLAHSRALKITTVYGGVGITKQEKDAVNSHIVVATPGRLEDLLQRGKLKLNNVEFLVLDEADRMLDMGFRPAVDRIVAKCPRERQTVFLSATLDGDAGRIAREYTSDAAEHAIEPDVDRLAAIGHRFVAVERDDRLKELVRELRGDRDLSLVFVRTKHGADRLVKRLAREGVKAVAMHGDKSQRQRERALDQFERGEVDTLVATDVAARGIDVRDISHVINFDPPEDGDTYTHRVGRTGRAGRTGQAVTFVQSDQARDVQKMAGQLGILKEFGQSGLLKSERGGAKPPSEGGAPRTTGARRRRRSSGGSGHSSHSGHSSSRGGR